MNDQMTKAIATLKTRRPDFPVDKFLNALSGVAEHILSTANTIGWAAAGQTIVYGQERNLGFCEAAELSGTMERAYRKTKKKTDPAQWVELFQTQYLTILADKCSE